MKWRILTFLLTDVCEKVLCRVQSHGDRPRSPFGENWEPGTHVAAGEDSCRSMTDAGIPAKEAENALTSTLSIAECTHVEGDTSLKVRTEFTNLLMSGQYIVLVQPTPFIMTDARDLRWGKALTLKGADAVHVASALDRKCNEFITTDKMAAKLNTNTSIAASGLKALAARNTQSLPDKYRQQSLLP